MAYSQVKVPRFYVNVVEWLHFNGVLNNIDEAYRTLPVNPTVYNPNISYDIPEIMTEKGFIFLLGHNLASLNYGFGLDYWDIVQHKVNSNPLGYDGFSLALFNRTDMPKVKLEVSEGAVIGSVVVGTYYDMPHSPDLSLTMEREYGGINTIETKGGASLSNSFYNKPPMWGSAGAWELYSGTPTNQKLSRSGRRVWNLSFSYLDDGDVFGSNQSLLTGEGSSGVYGGDIYTAYDDVDDLQNDGDNFTFDILSDDNFFSQVIHKTNGGQLPFIFQPDENDFTNMAICKFQQNSFKFERVALGIYNISLKIREVW